MHSFFSFFLFKNKILPGIISKGLNSYFDFVCICVKKEEKSTCLQLFSMYIFNKFITFNVSATAVFLFLNI